MSVQVIMRDGEAEYAVLPWAEYQALLKAANQASVADVAEAPGSPSREQRPFPGSISWPACASPRACPRPTWPAPWASARTI